MVSAKQLIDVLVELKDTSWQYKIASNPIYVTIIMTVIIMLLIVFFYSGGIFKLAFYIFVTIALLMMIHNSIIINEIKSEKISGDLMDLFEEGASAPQIVGQRDRITPSYITGGPPMQMPPQMTYAPNPAFVPVGATPYGAVAAQTTYAPAAQQQNIYGEDVI